jgi:CRISPR-associated exonuclease Cas4
MYTESELLPLSGLQHLLYCERQWALIHIEQQWAENRLTAQGRVLHRVVDEHPDESHSGFRVVRSLAVRSLRLGITGKADVVLFPLSGAGPPVPIEYKRGRPKPGDWDKVQLCAQALCLEEMLKIVVPEGALFYGLPRRRTVITFTEELRSHTEQAAQRMHELYRTGISPPAIYESKKCDRCSLLELCQPRNVETASRASRFLHKSIHESLNPDQETH